MKSIRIFGRDYNTTLIKSAAVIGILILTGILAANYEGNKGHISPETPYRIMIATDLHYLSPELTDNGSFFMELVNHGDGKAVMYSEELAEALVRRGLKEKPDVLILSGDLTFNGEKKSHQSLTKKLRKLRDAGVTVLVIPGNHDLNNGQASKFKGDSYERVDSVSALEFQELYKGFSSSYAVARDENSLSYMYESKKGVRLLMLDVNGVSQPGSVPEQTFHWIERQLKKAQKDSLPVIAVSHQTLLAHNRTFSEGFMIENGKRLEKLYEEYGVISNLSGHMHVQHTRLDGGIPEIVTGSAAVWPHYCGFLRFDGKRLDYQAEPIITTADTEENIGMMRLIEESQKLFLDTSYRQVIEELQGKGLTEKERNDIADYFVQLNSLYFRGRMDQRPKKDEKILWEQYTKGTFLNLYIKSILAEKPQNHTKLTVW